MPTRSVVDPSRSPSPLGPHEIHTAHWGVRMMLKTVLALLGTAVFLVLEFATDLGAQVGFLGLLALCLVPGLLLYVPLSRAAGAWVR